MISQDNSNGNGQPGAKLSRRAKKGHLNVIGISAGYHDSACTLLQDGVIVAAAQEERFSRVKNDRSWPVKASGTAPSRSPAPWAWSTWSATR
jgi:hypothetical protein